MQTNCSSVLDRLFRTVKASTSLKRVLVMTGVGILIQSANAAPITYNFTGIVTSVSPSLSGMFNTSQTLSVSFTYESSASGSLCGGCSESSGFSDYTGALTNFTMTIGPYTAAPPFGFDLLRLVQVVNNFALDRFVVGARLTGTPINGFNPAGFLSFDDPTLGAFADTRLVNVGDLTRWFNVPNRTASWYLAFSKDGGDPRIEGTLILATPETNSFVLVGSGIVVTILIKIVSSLVRLKSVGVYQ